MGLKSLIFLLALAVPLAMLGQSSSGEQQQQPNNHNSVVKPHQTQGEQGASSSSFGGGERQSSSEQNNQSQSLSQADKMFLKTLIRESLSEIDLAKMALAKSSNPDVQQYARTKILQVDPQLKAGAEKILQQAGIKPPTEPNMLQQKRKKKLATKSGRAFDAFYLSYEAAKQKADLQLVQKEIDTSNNSDVNSYAQNAEPHVSAASSSAIDLSTQLAKELRRYRQAAE